MKSINFISKMMDPDSVDVFGSWIVRSERMKE